MILKKIKDLYNNSGKWLSAEGVSISGDWTADGNVSALDNRVFDKFSEKYMAAYLQNLNASEITQRVADYLNSIVYELDTLYNSTTAEYNPISNYDMTESGRDVTRSNASGGTTSYATTYDDSSTERETGKTSTSGNTADTLIHSLQRSGNIGVTTSQQMLQSERDIAKFDFIAYVAEKIISEYTTSLYHPLEADMEVLI